MWIFIIGTRAEAIKVIPIIKQCKKQNIEFRIVGTGQHQLSKIFNDFDLDDFVLYLDRFSNKGSKYNGNTFKAILDIIRLPFKIKDQIQYIFNYSDTSKYFPDYNKNNNYVIYHGDTMASCAAAVASSRIFNSLSKNWRTVHIEAGLRSHSLKEPFPEEISRIISDNLSDIKLAPTELAMKNLKNVIFLNNKNCFLTGNTIVDSLDYIKRKYKIKSMDGKYGVVSIHRHENIKSRERLSKIVDLLISENCHEFIWPLHDNTRKQLERFDLMERVNYCKHIKIVEPLEYKDMIKLLAKCSFIVADGGSLQEEAYLLKKPIFICRKFTERQNLLSNNQWLISEEFPSEINEKDFKDDILGKNPSKKIVDILLKLSEPKIIGPIWYSDIGLWWGKE